MGQSQRNLTFRYGFFVVVVFFFKALKSSHSTELWFRRPGSKPHHCHLWYWACHLNHKEPPVPPCIRKIALTALQNLTNKCASRYMNAFVSFRCLWPWIPLFPINPDQRHPKCRGFSLTLEAGRKRKKRDDNSASLSVMDETDGLL